jgi:sec-independent protein translocase protein TatA
MFRNPTTDALIVLLIVLLIFGPKRLPGLGKQLGQGLREFKDSITGDSKDSEESERPQLSQPSAPVAPPAQTAAPAQPAQPPPAPPAQAAPPQPAPPAQGAPASSDASSTEASHQPEPAEIASSERRA